MDNAWRELLGTDRTAIVGGLSIRLGPLRLADWAELEREAERRGLRLVVWLGSDAGLEQAFTRMLRHEAEPGHAEAGRLLDREPGARDALRTALSAEAARFAAAGVDWGQAAWELSRRYGWTPRETAECTPAQVLAWLAETPATPRRRFASHREAGQYLAMRRA